MSNYNKLSLRTLNYINSVDKQTYINKINDFIINNIDDNYQQYLLDDYIEVFGDNNNLYYGELLNSTLYNSVKNFDEMVFIKHNLFIDKKNNFHLYKLDKNIKLWVQITAPYLLDLFIYSLNISFNKIAIIKRDETALQKYCITAIYKESIEQECIICGDDKKYHCAYSCGHTLCTDCAGKNINSCYYRCKDAKINNQIFISNIGLIE